MSSFDTAFPGSTPDSAAKRFFVGAWMNRRYTRLSSSIVLALPMTGLLIGQSFVLGWRAGAALPIVVLFALNAVFYPAAREGYYRITQPMREGLSGLEVSGILLIILFIIKLVIHVVLWSCAAVFGALSSLVLGGQEVRGRAWRIP